MYEQGKEQRIVHGVLRNTLNDVTLWSLLEEINLIQLLVEVTPKSNEERS